MSLEYEPASEPLQISVKYQNPKLESERQGERARPIRERHDRQLHLALLHQAPRNGSYT